MTDDEEFDEDDDDDDVHDDLNVDMPENLHHMPDVITTECEQHGKTHFFFIFFIPFFSIFIGFSFSIKHFPFLNIHYISFVAFQFNSIESFSLEKHINKAQ